jgi:hypothetical protein
MAAEVIADYAAYHPAHTTSPGSTQSFNVSVSYGYTRHEILGTVSKYAQTFDVIVIRLDFRDGTHEYRTIDVPMMDDPSAVTLE